jgi:hypothetical protein
MQRKSAEILGPPIRMGLDVSDNGPHPLQVVGLGRGAQNVLLSAFAASRTSTTPTQRPLKKLDLPATKSLQPRK